MAAIADRMLKFAVEALDDIEKTRMAMSNRLYILTKPADEADEDGTSRGFGLSDDEPVVAAYREMVEQLQKIEDAQVKLVQKTVKAGPLADFIKTATGVGEKQGARLIAAIGDPYWHTVEERPRTVSELWAYCGYHVLPVEGMEGVHVAPRRTKGVKSNWNGEARKRAWLIANSCVKTTGKYRTVYEEARMRHSEAVHAVECKPCAAKPGDPLKDGHKHARGLRRVAKEVLKDMWLASQEQHEGVSIQAARDKKHAVATLPPVRVKQYA